MRFVSNGPKKGIALELEVAFLNPNVEMALRNRIFLKQSFNILQVPKIWIASLYTQFGEPIRFVDTQMKYEILEYCRPVSSR
jgi:hypothetical protein